jgi:chromosome segregation ATPase
MTFSRPAIERLIARVESGLQYDELGPYAQGLRDALAEVDSSREDVEHFASQCRTSNADIRDLRAELARLTAERDNARWADETRKKACEALITERDAMRPVVEAAEKWRDASTDDEDALLMSGLMCAIDAYRATKDRP